jgi:hypothetical protein
MLYPIERSASAIQYSTHFEPSMPYGHAPRLIEESLEVKLRTIWKDGKAEVG